MGTLDFLQTKEIIYLHFLEKIYSGLIPDGRKVVSKTYMLNDIFKMSVLLTGDHK